MIIIPLLVIIGLFTGLLSGLLGIGGGVITAPAFFFIFIAYYGHPEYLMHACIGTTLATTFLTSIGSTLAHYKKKTIGKTILKITIPGFILGAILGILVSSLLSSTTIQIAFGIVAILFAIYFVLPHLKPLHIAKAPNFSLSFFALCIGMISNILGIGGGTFMLPILLGYQLPLKQAVANASAGTLITTFLGTICYLLITPNSSPIPYSVGYVCIPAMLITGLSSICTTSLGCKLSHSLSHDLMKKIFALVLLITGICMLI